MVNVNVIRFPSAILFTKNAKRCDLLGSVNQGYFTILHMKPPSNFFSPLSADDTYSKVKHFLVQRDTLKFPWSREPCSFVCQTGEEEDRLLWQAAKITNLVVSG